MIDHCTFNAVFMANPRAWVGRVFGFTVYLTMLTCKKVIPMHHLLQKSTAALLALILLFSVMMTPAFAAELDEENEGSSIAGVGAELEQENGENAAAEVGAELTDENGDPSAAEVGAGVPEFTSVRCVREGVRMEWKALDGAAQYRVDKWYDDGRGWQKLTVTTGLYYTDTAVTSGNTYKYRLYGLNAGGSVVTTTTSKSIIYSVPAQVTDAQTMADGIRIDWQKDAGVSKVAVFRMENDSWKRIAVSTGTSYLDQNVSYGSEYRYTVRALKDNGEYMHDYYDDNGMSHRFLKTPTLRAESAVGGVMLRWDAIEDAESYRIFYRNSSGGWSRMAVTQNNYLLDDDVRSGNSYTYTVRCITADGERYTSYCDTAGKSVYYVATPVLLSADGTDDGIRISWQASPGAAKYRVFFKNSKGQWARIYDTADTSYLDMDVLSGVSYTYTVRCLDAAGNYVSSYDDTGITGRFLSSPVVTVSNGTDGVDIKWTPVDGAEKYRVYYYGSRGWTKMVDTTETSYTDEDVVSGWNYTYTVRCINAAGTEFTSGFLPGKKIQYFAAPTITSIESAEDGVLIKWNAVGGAQKYRVYYRGANGWTKMVDTAQTSYLDTEVVSGTTYTYTVRCVNNAGDAFMSYFKPGVSQKFVSAPDFKLTRNENSITVSWDEVTGAELYRVYYYGATGWRKLVDTTSTSFEDKDIRSGESYTYTVRCLNKEATAFTSDCHAGQTITYVETPYVTSVKGGPEGVEISWSSSQGASKYRVYYKGDNGWTKVGESTTPFFIHTAAESGRDYTYTVRCISADGSEFESNFDPVGKSLHYIAAPQNIKTEVENNTIRISWTPSGGAAKYRVYYYGRNGWTKLTETTGSSVIDDDVASGYTYRYTVRCISADGKSFTSDFNHDGVECPFTTMPVLYEPDYTKDGIEISWKASPGAAKYRVYYYGSRGWTKLTETTSTSVVDDDVSSGYSYRYTVRCITADGRAFTSDCDTDGVKVYYVDAPWLTDQDTSSNELTFSWSKPRGATKFRVYKKIYGSWTRLTDTTSTSYTDTSVSTGSTYSYTVRVINDSGTAFYSGFDPSGFIITVVSTVTGFVYYDQTDYSYPYGDDTIAGSGCGPTCFAMIASTIKGRSITPIDAVQWCGNKYYLDNVGTYWSYFGAAASRFGTTLEKDVDGSDTATVITALKQGKYVISSQGYGRFTRGGHFIVLAGITASGKVIVYDPNGYNNYIGTAFSMSEVAEAGTHYWIFS